MASTAQGIIDELYRQGQQQAAQLHSQRQQADEDTIRQLETAADKTTAAAVRPYESQLEQLPAQYRPLYDANAVQELVGRRQVEEAMANMGLTDSGLNRTQQTALTVQRGNADAAARLSQQQKSQELQDKISQLLEAGEVQKQQQAAVVRQDTADWYSSTLADLYSQAVEQGTRQYQAQQEAEAARRTAEARIQQQKALQEAAAAQQRIETQLAQARSRYATGGQGELYNHLLAAQLAGIITEDEAVAIYNQVLGEEKEKEAEEDKEEEKEKSGSLGKQAYQLPDPGLFNAPVETEPFPLGVVPANDPLASVAPLYNNNVVRWKQQQMKLEQMRQSQEQEKLAREQYDRANWKSYIMTSSEFNRRKRAGSSAVAGYSNYDDYYAAMKRQYGVQ